MIVPPIVSLRPWAQKDRFSASHLQESPEAINALITALSAAQDDGTSPIGVEGWPGIISAKGPNGEDDFTDERYWVQRAFVKGAAPNAQITVQQEVAPSTSSATTPSGVGADQNASNIFVVTNLLEQKTHLHSLVPGTAVWFWGSWDAGLTSVPADGTDASQPDNQKHYLMSVYARPMFKITGTSTKPGTYTANPMKAPTAVLDPTSSSAMAETDFGVALTSTTVYLINISEKGNTSGHTQSAGVIVPGDLRGFAADGKPVYEIEAC